MQILYETISVMSMCILTDTKLGKALSPNKDSQNYNHAAMLSFFVHDSMGAVGGDIVWLYVFNNGCERIYRISHKVRKGFGWKVVAPLLKTVYIPIAV
jgi:hypothetical protein